MLTYADVCYRREEEALKELKEQLTYVDVC